MKKVKEEWETFSSRYLQASGRGSAVVSFHNLIVLIKFRRGIALRRVHWAWATMQTVVMCILNESAPRGRKFSIDLKVNLENTQILWNTNYVENGVDNLALG